MNEHSEPLFQKSNFSPPGMINFSNFFVTVPKTFQWANCGMAEHHGSLVTKQKLASWRL